jgi:hypothetical protein
LFYHNATPDNITESDIITIIIIIIVVVVVVVVVKLANLIDEKVPHYNRSQNVLENSKHKTHQYASVNTDKLLKNKHETMNIKKREENKHVIIILSGVT